MPMLPRLRSVLRNTFRRAQVDRDLEQELESYVVLLEDEQRSRGVSATDARRRALVATGGVQQVKEEVRRVRAGALLELVAHDARIAIRALRRSPGFALSTVSTLAIGIGATVTVLAIADALLFRPLPYRDADRLVTVLHDGSAPVSPANFLDWRERLRSIPQLEAAEYWSPTISEGDPERIVALRVTPGMFGMLGARPALGAAFSTAELMAAPREVVIAHSLWQRRFGGDSSVVGRTVSINDEPYVVTGVMEPRFRFAPFWATEAELWSPLPLAARSTDRRASSLRVFGRLAPAATLEGAQREVATITAELEARHPGSNARVRVDALRTKAVGNVRPAVLTVLGAVAFMLLITCINVAHLLLARAAVRQREVALRVVLGATHGRVIGQALTEVGVLVALGTIGGLAIATATLRLALAGAPPELALLSSLAFDGRFAAIALGSTLVTALLLATLPAVMARRSAIAAALRDGVRGTTTGARPARLRQWLIASEIAFAVILLVGTGLMVRSFAAMRAVDPGFDTHGLMTMRVPLPRSARETPEARLAYFRALLENARATPGVSDVALTNHLPLDGDEWGRPVYGGHTANAAPGDELRTIYRVVTPGWFRTMGIALLRGRDVADTDDLSHPPVIVINQRLAEQLWPGEDPIGRQLTFDAPDESRRWLTVIGVTRDTRQSQWTAAATPEFYLPYAQDEAYLRGGEMAGYLTLAARVRGEPAALVAAVRRHVREADPAVPVTHVQTMDAVVDRVTARARLMMTVLGAFGVVALVLAGIGIHGIMSYAVEQRRQEIGIRMALGARAGEVVRGVLRQAALVSGAGIAIGVAGSLALTRFVASQLYGVGPLDPASYVAAVLVLGAAALAASAMPARRATKVDPLLAMRGE